MSTPPSERPIDILVVDDAVVVRRILNDVLASDPALRVVGTAPNGRIALQKLQQVRPDIVTLDFEMPELSGLETLKAIRETHPKLPVIMFSSVTERGAAQTVEALACGASDYVTKPAHTTSVGEAQQRVREQLIPKIKALCGRRSAPTSVASPRRVPQAKAVAAPGGRAPEAIVIGVSTGGPNALAEMLPGLPKDLDVPVLIVQHMPPMFTRMLAERLDHQCPLSVVEAKADMEIRPGTVYIAPGDFHLTVERRGTAIVTALNQDPQENSCRPAVDVLFRSASGVWADRLLAVVLTGMGQDGLRGAEEVHRRGGRIITQDQATSVVWGMPGFVTEAGLSEAVLPLQKIAEDITRRCRRAALKLGA